MSMQSVGRSVLRAGVAAGAVYATLTTLKRIEEREHNAQLGIGRKFLVLGSGFAGAAVAQELARLLPGENNGEIVLIDADNYLLFTPMLTEAAGGQIDPRHIASPIRAVDPRINFVQGRITAIDLPARSVQVDVGSSDLDPQQQTFTADHLVIALGSVVTYHDAPGVAEHSISMKKLDDATEAFERVSACLERAAIESDAAKRQELLTFVVGGGGYTGVETMAAINDLVRMSVQSLPRIRPDEVRTILVHPGKRLLEEITPELAAFAQQKLEERGVEVQLSASIESAGEDFVQIKGGPRISARTLIWAAGVKPNPLIESLPATKGKHHGLSVDGCCQVPGHPGVWALGDCAEVPTPDGKGTYAPVAQNATREGTLVARNIVRNLRDEPLQVFKYKPMGELALVGRHSGVARVFGVNLSGIVAWAMWRAVYLAKMPNLSQQTRILTDWVLDAILGSTAVPITTGHRK